MLDAAKKKRRKRRKPRHDDGVPILKCVDPKYTYSVILPPTYEEKKNKKFPTLFISSWSGKPSARGFVKWAAENEVIIILNRTTRNGKEDDSHALKVLMNTVEPKYRIHPFLRFSTGVSGGAEVSAHLAVEFPKKWAGVVLQAHSGNGRYPPKHCAVAFLSGKEDKVHNFKYVMKAYETLKKSGNPVHIKGYPGKGHGPAPIEDVLKELDWMLNLEKYTHPSIGIAYIKETKKEIETEIDALANITDIHEKISRAEKLLNVPWIKTQKGYLRLIGEYADTRLKVARNTKKELRSWGIFMDLLYSDFFTKLTRNIQEEILTTIKKLEVNQDIVKEKMPLLKYYKVEKLHKKYNTKKKRTQKERLKIVSSYTYIIDKYPGTLAARKAQKAKRQL